MNCQPNELCRVVHNNLTLKQKRAGMFGKGLRNAITAKQRAALS